MHFQRKEFKLDEDPWDNYLFHDAQLLAPIICHSEPLTVAEQVIVAKFIEVTLKAETISQYKIQGNKIIQELLQFARGFESGQQADEESEIIDEEALGKKAKEGLANRIELMMENKPSLEEQEKLLQDMNRMLRMFYLEMRVKGKLSELKNDYFA